MAAPYRMSRIDRVYRSYSVAATDENEWPVAPAGVDFALTPTDVGSPGAATTWTAGEAANGRWRALLAGPDADQTSAIPVPPWGGKLWLRVTDSPEVIARIVDVIAVD